MKFVSRSSLVAVCALAVAGGVLEGCAARAQAQPVERIPVAIAVESAAPVGPRPLYRGPGAAAAAHTYRLGFELQGRVSMVGADLGDRVAAGEVLARIDDADARQQAEAASARAASARAQAERAERGSRPEERAQAGAAVASARAALARAEAAAALAQLNDARYRALAASGDVAAQQADTARTAALDAEQQVAAARAQLASVEESAALVESGPRGEDRASAAADARAAQAAAESARTTLGKTVLRAPADALVQSRSIEPGDLAQPGSVVFVLADAGPADVIVHVPEARLEGIAGGTPATVFANGKRFSAHVFRIEPVADDAARAYEVRLRLDAGALRPGTVVDAAIGARTEGDAAVPAGALLRDGSGWHLETYAPRERSVRSIPVRVVASDGPREIVTGVRAGTPIVVMGQNDARPGDAVRIVQP